MERIFKPLTDAEREWIRDQLGLASQFVQSFAPDTDDGRLTLKSLDWAFKKYLDTDCDPSTANEIVLAVGVAFGTSLVKALGFAWAVVTDEYGTDLAVVARPGRGDVTIVPGDFVAKRYERREAPFLADAFAEIKRQLQKVGEEWGESV